MRRARCRRIERGSVVLTLAAASLLIPAAASAHITSDREVQVLRGLSDSLVTHLRLEDSPDSNGLCGDNRRGGFRASYQVPGLRVLADAAARRDSAMAERAWRVIDAALVMQRPGGRFERIEKRAAVDTLLAWEDAVAWLAELNRTVAVVMNGPLQNAFRLRWALLRPKLERSMNGLVAMSPALEARAKRDPVRLFSLAEAFLLADGHYHDPAYGLAGQRALAAALALQRTNGSFAAKSPGRFTSDVRCLDAIEALGLYFPAPFLERAGAKLAPRVEAGLAAASAKGTNPVADAALKRVAGRTLAIRAGRLALGPPPAGAGHPEEVPASR